MLSKLAVADLDSHYWWTICMELWRHKRNVDNINEVIFVGALM